MRAFGFDAGAGVTVNSAAIAAAYASVPNGALVLEFPEGTAEVQVPLRSNTSFVGLGSTTSILKSGSGCLVTGDSGSPLASNNFRDIHFRNLGFVGRQAEDGFNEQSHLINLNGVTQVSFRSCRFSSWRGDAIYLGSSNTAGVERHNEAVTIAACDFVGSNNERNGVSIIDGRLVWIGSCTFTNVSRSNMIGPIDVEPNPPNTWAITKDIKISNNTFTGTQGLADIALVFQVSQADLTTDANGFTITGNVHNSPEAQLLYAIAYVPADASTPSYGIVYSGNTQLADIATADIILNGIRGATFTGNTFRPGHFYSIGATYACFDIIGAP